MPREIEMDQNLTNGPIEADSPYFGADEPEDDNDEVDFGDEVDPAAAVERETECRTRAAESP